MLMCTDPGDLVLDPTCGSGTTAYVAEQWGRRWITIDTSRVALALARQRLMGASIPYYLLADSPDGPRKEAELTGRGAAADAATGDIRQGFVYERVQHVTLEVDRQQPRHQGGHEREPRSTRRSTATPTSSCSTTSRTRTRRRSASPDRSRSRACRPHRSLRFRRQAETAEPETDQRADAANDAEARTFEQTILDNLAQAGIQNGRRAERIEFAHLRVPRRRHTCRQSASAPAHRRTPTRRRPDRHRDRPAVRHGRVRRSSRRSA